MDRLYIMYIYITMLNFIGMTMVLYYVRKGLCFYEIHANIFMGKVSSWLYLPYFHMIQKMRERERKRKYKMLTLNVDEGHMSGHRKQIEIDKLEFINWKFTTSSHQR